MRPFSPCSDCGTRRSCTIAQVCPEAPTSEPCSVAAYNAINRGGLDGQGSTGEDGPHPDAEATAVQATGAVRSADVDEFSYTSLPPLGLMAVARTAGEGAAKYGRFNYHQGFPIHGLLEHSMHHLVMYLAGDRSQPHLPHAAWGLLVACQEDVLRPEANAKDLLGPGLTMPQAMIDDLKAQEPTRKAQRDAGVFRKAGQWCLAGLRDVQALLTQRRQAEELVRAMEDER